MLPRVVEASMKFRLLVLACAAGLLLAGVAQLRSAPVDVLPEFAPPVVQVQTESLGLSAAEVEQLITVPLEQDLLNGVPGVATIRSDSIPGLSEITMIFERDTTLLRDRQLVQERLTQAFALPNVSKPAQMLQPVSSTSRVMMIGLSSSKLSPIELSVLARWTIRPRLLGLAGVANVALWGFRDRQLQVLVDPKHLHAHGVTLDQLVKTTGNAQLVSPLSYVEASTPGTGGFIDGPNQRLGVRHIVPFGKPANLGQVPIERGHGGPLRLGDVARVEENHQPLIGDAVVGGAPGLLLVVQKLPGANTLTVTHEIDAALDALRPGLAGVRIDSHVFRPASHIESALSNLTIALTIAAAMMISALAAFFLEWRAVLVNVVAIALSLVAAAVVLAATGATINALVLLGLLVALGIVIDDAIGDVQHVVWRLGERGEGNGSSPARILLAASLEMRGALGYATLIALLAMVPVFFAGGQSGVFVHPMALSYALAVLASMLVALTVTPALSFLLYGRAPRERRESPTPGRLAHGYERLLARTIRSPRPALAMFAGLLLAGVVVLLFATPSLHPAFKDRNVLVHWNATPSTGLPEMERITARASEELRALRGVRDVGAHVGRAVNTDQTVGTGSGEIWLTIDKGADYDATVRSIRDVVGGYPGMRAGVLTYESDSSRGVLQGARDAAVVRVYGQDYGVLRSQADRVRQSLSGIRGLRDPQVELPAEQPTLEVEPKLLAAGRYGLKPGDIRRAAGTLVNGLEVGSVFEQQKVFSVVVRGVPATRMSVTSIRNLLIDTPGGGQVPLGKVARVRITPNPVDIRHDAVSPYIDVRGVVHGRELGSVQAEVQRRLQRVSFPLAYHAELLKPSADERASSGQFLILAIAAVIGIFLLLQAAFGSWRLAALLFFTIPAADVGGLLVVGAGGGQFSLGAAVGLIAVLVIAARNVVVVIVHLQRGRDRASVTLPPAERLEERPALEGVERLEERAGGPTGAQLVLSGMRERFAPLVMTAVTIGLALLPLALAGDVAGNEITHSTAGVVLGGLVTSTVFSLFIVPALYLHYGASAPIGLALHDRRPAAPVATPVHIDG
jgi:Cu/Ag efflux pump CusA